MGLSNSKPTKNLVVFSVYQQSTAEGINKLRHEQALIKLETYGISYKVVQGFYKGASELSIILDSENLVLAKGFACQYKQESILLLDEAQAHGVRRAHLLYSGDSKWFLGYFREVTNEYALTCDGYTYDINTGRYYACVDAKNKTTLLG